MSLVSVKALLQDATARGYGIPAINVFNFESIHWAILAAEKEQMPLIIQFYPGFKEHMPLNAVTAVTKALLHDVTAPIGLHLDHSHSYEIALEGAGAGFPSIMIDGSALPYEQNARVTADVTRAAHAMGLEVEGELGHVGSGDNLADFQNPELYTSVDEAKRFAAETGIDTLAVAVGNGHGLYAAAPKLDFERISALRKALTIPLVMHGGSDIPADQTQEAVRRGMSKFNIATEYSRRFHEIFLKQLGETDVGFFYSALRAVENDAVDFIRSKISLLNPDGVRM